MGAASRDFMRAIAASLPIAAVALSLAYCNTAPSTPPTMLAKWPERPDAESTNERSSVTFAVDSLTFGESIGNSWAQHGFDLDGKVTTSRSTDVCTRFQGASSRVQVDGVRGFENGIDNSFGENLVEMVENLLFKKVHSLSENVTSELARGRFTIQLQTTGLLDTPNQTNVGLVLQSFPSSEFAPDGAAPSTGDWPVRSDGLADASVQRARDTFPNAYVSHGSLVSGLGELTLGMKVEEIPIDLHLSHAVVVMNADGDRASGTIAGVLDVEEFIASARLLAQRFSPSLCQRSAFEGLANQFRQMADILHDGTNQAGFPCDGISFGVGFTARRIANPSRVSPPPAPHDVCAPPPEGGPDAHDAGWSLACKAGVDCAGADSGSSVCCASVAIGNDCHVNDIVSSCQSETKCATYLPASCGLPATVRMCASAADCTEALYPKCCALPPDLLPAAPYFCVSNLLAGVEQCN